MHYPGADLRIFTRFLRSYFQILSQQVIPSYSQVSTVVQHRRKSKKSKYVTTSPLQPRPMPRQSRQTRSCVAMSCIALHCVVLFCRVMHMKPPLVYQTVLHCVCYAETDRSGKGNRCQCHYIDLPPPFPHSTNILLKIASSASFPPSASTIPIASLPNL